MARTKAVTLPAGSRNFAHWLHSIQYCRGLRVIFCEPCSLTQLQGYKQVYVTSKQFLTFYSQTPLKFFIAGTLERTRAICATNTIQSDLAAKVKSRRLLLKEPFLWLPPASKAYLKMCDFQEAPNDSCICGSWSLCGYSHQMFGCHNAMNFKLYCEVLVSLYFLHKN